MTALRHAIIECSERVENVLLEFNGRRHRVERVMTYDITSSIIIIIITHIRHHDTVAHVVADQLERHQHGVVGFVAARQRLNELDHRRRSESVDTQILHPTLHEMNAHHSLTQRLT
jgi:hypothetical protein